MSACRSCLLLLVGVVLRWLRADWLPLTNYGDVAAPPKPLLKLPILFVCVRRLPERYSVFTIVYSHSFYPFRRCKDLFLLSGRHAWRPLQLVSCISPCNSNHWGLTRGSVGGDALAFSLETLPQFVLLTSFFVLSSAQSMRDPGIFVGDLLNLTEAHLFHDQYFLARRGETFPIASLFKEGINAFTSSH